MEHGAGVAEHEGRLYGLGIFAPGAEFIILDVLHESGLDGILMDIAQEGSEILHVVDWL